MKSQGFFFKNKVRVQPVRQLFIFICLMIRVCLQLDFKDCFHIYIFDCILTGFVL
ncbi:hypothetical protein BY458DRAFT_512648 [Sporodiniella umbellata]|nr:hypothetical protein BY458DRAFT_512648 [Sporodiniella umbellata]